MAPHPLEQICRRRDVERVVAEASDNYVRGFAEFHDQNLITLWLGKCMRESLCRARESSH